MHLVDSYLKVLKAYASSSEIGGGGCYISLRVEPEVIYKISFLQIQDNLMYVMKLFIFETVYGQSFLSWMCLPVYCRAAKIVIEITTSSDSWK